MTTCFNEERTYGAEIEFFTPGIEDRETIAAKLRALGLNVKDEQYNHNTRSYWKVVTDSSVHGNGLELVSPPLKGREGLAELKLACETLASVGAKVDKSCGLHVHHNANDLTVENFKRLFATYLKYEKLIDSFLPESRRDSNNQFCESLKGRYCTIEERLAQIKQSKTLESLRNIWGTRYLKLNIESYFRHGTIEFRQHSGTLDFEKISNWIIFTQRMVEVSLLKDVKYTPITFADPSKFLRDYLETSNKYGASEQLINAWKYLLGRRQYFKNNEAVAA